MYCQKDWDEKERQRRREKKTKKTTNRFFACRANIIVCNTVLYKTKKGGTDKQTNGGHVVKNQIKNQNYEKQKRPTTIRANKPKLILILLNFCRLKIGITDPRDCDDKEWVKCHRQQAHTQTLTNTNANIHINTVPSITRGKNQDQKKREEKRERIRSTITVLQ